MIKKPAKKVVKKSIKKDVKEELVMSEPEVVEVNRNNMIVIDDVTGESIPPITNEKVEVHLAPGLYEEHHMPTEPVKKLEPSTTGTTCDPRDVCVVVSPDQPHTKWTIVNNEIN